jgi:hypothetical protein
MANQFGAKQGHLVHPRGISGRARLHEGSYSVPALPGEKLCAQRCGTVDQIRPQLAGSAVDLLVALIEFQHILRNLDDRFAFRDRAALTKGPRVGHDPTLGYVRPTVGAVSREEGRGVTLAGLRIFSKKSHVHGASYLRVGEISPIMAQRDWHVNEEHQDPGGLDWPIARNVRLGKERLVITTRLRTLVAPSGTTVRL